MGSKMSPTFASLYVGLFEHELIFDLQENPFLQYISHWKRYLDDVFFIWKGPEHVLQEFHSFINSRNEHLKFTMSCDRTKMNFLDIMVMKDRGYLKTDLYRKPTDKNSLLHGDSYHPTSLKKNLPISQFNRIRRICSSDETFNTQTNELMSRFRNRGYKEPWIQGAAARFSSISQTECLAYTRPKKTERRVVCAIQYSPVSRDIAKVIDQHWHIIDTDPALKNVFSNSPRVVYKRPPNLRNMLVRADLPPLPSSQPSSNFLGSAPSGNYPCGRCQQCHFTQKTTSFNHPHTGKKI